MKEQRKKLLQAAYYGRQMARNQAIFRLFRRLTGRVGCAVEWLKSGAQPGRQALGIDAAHIAKAGGDEGDHAVIGGIEIRGLALASGEAIDAAGLGQGKRQRA